MGKVQPGQTISLKLDKNTELGHQHYKRHGLPENYSKKQNAKTDTEEKLCENLQSFSNMIEAV